MAWLTAKADAPENTFTAGTVAIEAGGTQIRSQYFDPGEAWYLYGVEFQTGNLYEIDILNQTATMFYETDMAALAPADTYSPNGLAFDNDSRRLYFSIVRGSTSQIYFYDFGEQELVDGGTVPGTNYGATFGLGYYWYMPNGTDDLYRVALDGDGKVEGWTIYDNIAGGLSFNFGDIVIDIRDGIIYGSTSLSGLDTMFFTYDIDSGDFEEVEDADAMNLQLAFGSDGKLYGHHTWDQTFFEIDPSTGMKLTADLEIEPHLSFNDLASGYVSVWNPGDCSKARYWVHNTGTKNIRVRAIASGEWEFNWGWLWDNRAALCFTKDYPDMDFEEFKEAVEALADPVVVTLCEDVDDWVEEDGYFYYIGDKDPIEFCNRVRLCVRVCLDGPLATNEFQAGTYTLVITFEAIQYSNYAPYYQWGTELYDTP